MRNDVIEKLEKDNQLLRDQLLAFQRESTQNTPDKSFSLNLRPICSSRQVSRDFTLGSYVSNDSNAGLSQDHVNN